MPRPYGLALILLLCTFIVSCSSNGCENNQNAIPMAGFYDYATRESLTVSGLSVYGVGAPNDSLVMAPTKTAHQVWLPFRGLQDFAAFRFDFGEEENTVTFSYDAIPYYEGEDCGAMWRYHITNVEWDGATIDSVSVTDPIITNIERERIMIFLTLPDE